MYIMRQYLPIIAEMLSAPLKTIGNADLFGTIGAYMSHMTAIAATSKHVQLFLSMALHLANKLLNIKSWFPLSFPKSMSKKVNNLCFNSCCSFLLLKFFAKIFFMNICIYKNQPFYYLDLTSISHKK